MILSAILAASSNHVIGKNGTLPWHFSSDLRRFKKLTMGHPVIMGRKCYEDIGAPLPGRKNIVVTSQPDYKADGCIVAHDDFDAFRQATMLGDEECFVIGGKSIYEKLIDHIDRIYYTEVGMKVEGTETDTLTVLDDKFYAKMYGDFENDSDAYEVVDENGVKLRNHVYNRYKHSGFGTLTRETFSQSRYWERPTISLYTELKIGVYRWMMKCASDCLKEIELTGLTPVYFLDQGIIGSVCKPKIMDQGTDKEWIRVELTLFKRTPIFNLFMDMLDIGYEFNLIREDKKLLIANKPYI
jgi:dihydrofolate reductase